MHHNWSVSDDEEALNAYLNDLPKSERIKIAQKLGIGISSFELKMYNFRYLDTGGKKGLAKYSTQAKEVWESHIRQKE